MNRQEHSLAFFFWLKVWLVGLVVFIVVMYSVPDPPTPNGQLVSVFAYMIEGAVGLKAGFHLIWAINS